MKLAPLNLLTKNFNAVFLITLPCLALVVVSCASSPKRPFDKNNWRSKMHEISSSVSILLPLSFNREKFYDPKNQAKIEAELHILAKNAQNLDKEKFVPNGDPGLKFSSKRFAQDMVSTYRQFKKGHKRHVRYMIRNVSNYCINCHTRFQQGRSNLTLWKPNLRVLPKSEKAKYFIATRQYKKAHDMVLTHLRSNNTSKPSLSDWEYVIEKALAYAVRVKKSPKMVLEIGSSILKNKKMPKYLKARARSWNRSALAWRRDNKGSTNDDLDPYESAHDLLKRAQRIGRYDKISGLIETLRASAEITSILTQGESHPDYGDSLYLAGQISEHLNEVDIWTIQQSYYEKCIQTYPHTHLASNCFERLEAVISEQLYGDDFESYIPEHVQIQLQELDRLSIINEQSPSQKYLDERFWEDQKLQNFKK